MRMLIVEDEKEIADGICKILEKAKYQVDCVYDGISGLDYILSEIYDLVLLDVMLPKLNGFDIVKNMRSQGIYTPVIMLTAKSQVNDKITGFKECVKDSVIQYANHYKEVMWIMIKNATNRIKTLNDT